MGDSCSVDPGPLLQTLLQALGTGLSSGVLICGPDRRLLAANEAFATLLGLEEGWREDCALIARTVRACLAACDAGGEVPGPGAVRIDVRTLPGDLLCVCVAPRADERADRTDTLPDPASTLLREIIDSVDASIVVYDELDRFVTGNRRYFELYPHLPDDGSLVGKTFEDMLRYTLHHGPPAEEQARTDPEAFVARRLGEWKKSGDREQLHPSGRWDLLRNRVTQSGKRVTLRVDITEQKRLQMELSAARDELVAASSAKSNFLAAMSHELRTPLNAIIGFAEVLGNEYLGPVGSPRYKEYAHDILSSGRHLLDLIGTVLDLAKIEAGQRIADLETFDLKPLLERHISMMRTVAAERDNRVRLMLDQPDLTLTGDPQMVAQMLLNLLSNAIKFTSDGVVTVSAARLASGQLALAVADTGRGIPRDKLEMLGTPFYQIRRASRHTPVGSGLGLAIVKEMMALHGGSLVLESDEGRGTTATLLFPPPDTTRSAVTR